MKILNSEFLKLIDNFEFLLDELLNMPPVTMEKPILNSPKNGGIYLFSSKKKHLYVGRTKKQISARLRQHIRSGVKDSPLAFKIARIKTGNKIASYGGDHTRSALLENPIFVAKYEKAKLEIKKMDIRWVSITEPTKQALFEIYAAVTLNTPYNDFNTH